MGYDYAILGSGRQGTAAASDLAHFGDAESILMADSDLAQAERSAGRMNQLVGCQVACPAQVNVMDAEAIVRLLTSHDPSLGFGGGIRRRLLATIRLVQ
jgi:lysine 6-dehydrogenase